MRPRAAGLMPISCRVASSSVPTSRMARRISISCMSDAKKLLMREGLGAGFSEVQSQVVEWAVMAHLLLFDEKMMRLRLA